MFAEFFPKPILRSEIFQGFFNCWIVDVVAWGKKSKESGIGPQRIPNKAGSFCSSFEQGCYQHGKACGDYRSRLENRQGGGGTFQVRVGPVLTQHMRGWGGTFHRLCWGRVNTSNRYVVRVVCCVVLFSF